MHCQLMRPHLEEEDHGRPGNGILNVNVNVNLYSASSQKAPLMNALSARNYNILATLLGEVQDSWHLQS